MTRAQDVAHACEAILTEVERVIVGKREALELLLVGVLASGHVLLEDYPGLAKTLIARLLAQVMGLEFRRVQFTPDLLPSDITGSAIYDQASAGFIFQPGPSFTNLLLGDEINRTPPKTQAALLEAMQERQVTVDGVTHELTPPFIVLATQNPIEYEGTYPLPEAQLDRFIMKVAVGYPTLDQEVKILENRLSRGSDDMIVNPRITTKMLLEMQEEVEKIHVERSVLNYITEIVRSTREHPDVEVGSSPRGTLALLKLSRARAWLHGRKYVIPDDVKQLTVSAIAHRLILKPELWLKGEKYTELLVKELVERIPVPKVD